MPASRVIRFSQARNLPDFAASGKTGSKLAEKQGLDSNNGHLSVVSTSDLFSFPRAQC